MADGARPTKRSKTDKPSAKGLRIETSSFFGDPDSGDNGCRDKKGARNDSEEPEDQTKGSLNSEADPEPPK